MRLVMRAPIDALSPRHKWGVLAICSMSTFMVGLDITAVNIAVPDIGQDMHASIAELQWSVSAFALVMASLLMLAGSTADRFGRKRIFICGFAVFTAASLLCSVAPSVEFLVASRVLQGVGASMLNPVAMSLITNTFLLPAERARAVGLWGTAFGVSMALGPVAGGTLVSALGWRSIFLINIPLGLAAILLTLRFIPESKAPVPRRVDPVGQLLVFVLLSGLIFAIIQAPTIGWSSGPVLAAFLAFGVALAALLSYEPRRSEPLVDLRFFRSVPFTASIVASVAAFATFAGFLFLNTLYLQDVRGLSPRAAGSAGLPMALMIMTMPPISGRIVGRRGPRVPLVICGICFVVACTMLIDIDAGTPMWWLLAAYAVFGIGFGFVNAPITTVAVSGMPRAQAGVASAIATTSRMFGQALGVAVVGALVTSRPAHPDFSSAAEPAWWTLTVCGGLVLGLGVAATSRAANRSARRTAAALNPEALAAYPPGFNRTTPPCWSAIKDSQ
jgi:EmrB/QacA subfamily drug resistance transporter